MAYESITVTPGVSGVSVAFDVVSGLYLPIGKMDVGGDGASIPVVGRSALSAVPIEHREWVDHVTVSGISTTATAYYTGQVIGGLIEIPGASRIAAGGGAIRQVTVHLVTPLVPYDMDVLFFSDQPGAPVADNADLDVSAADFPLWLGNLQVSSPTQPSGGMASGSIFTFVADDWQEAALRFKLPSGQTSLWCYVIATNGITLGTVTDLSVTVTVQQF